MTTSKILLTISLGLMLNACGAWKQDPLDGKKGNFGEAKPVPTKPDLSKPLDSKAVRIYIPDFQSFQEGVMSEFSITARVLLEGYKAEVSVENLADFPRATYDQATGMFRWTPPVGYVDSTGENGVIAQKSLVIRAYGYKTGDQVLVGEAERPLYVAREFRAPEITNVVKTESFVREGNTSFIQVTVFDKEAVATDRATWPKLTLQSISGAKSLAGQISVSRDENLGNNQYRIYLQVDVRDVELTGSIDTFKVGLIANSRFGKVSPMREVALDVYTSFASPVTTWTEVLQTRETEPTTYRFLITDPKLEANLSLDRTFSMPLGSILSCQATGRGLLNCTFTWTPPEGYAGSYEVQAYIKSRNFDSRDSMQPTKTLYFRTRVLPKGS